MSGIIYRETCVLDKEQIAGLIRERWGTEYIIVHSTIYLPHNLDGYLALEDGNIAGLITYTIENNECEIVTLDSLKEHCGIGTGLVNLVVEKAVENKCHTVWLITTNDNEKAASFYRNRGFELTEIFCNAADESRKIKPEIPLTGENGITITDELKFCLKL